MSTLDCVAESGGVTRGRGPAQPSKYLIRLMSLYILNTIFNDAAQPWQIGFQDSAAPGFTGIVELHND